MPGTPGISLIIAEALKRQGGNNTKIGDRIGVSSQLLGQYERGDKDPKLQFYMSWRREFGEDLLAEVETKVYALPAVQKARLSSQAPTTEKRIDTLESNLGTVLQNQDGLLNFVTELLYRDCLKEAKGNAEKAQEILDEILHRISPELGSRLKRGIHDGDGNADTG